MKTSFLRAAAALIAGILMIEYREDMVTWLVVAIGAVFFVAGVVSTVCYFVERRRSGKELPCPPTAVGGESLPAERKPAFPIAGIGCALLGVILALSPGAFVDGLVYIFAAIIILGAVGQYASLISIRAAVSDFERSASVKVSVRCLWAYWLLPTLLLLFGVVAILHPRGTASSPFLFMGIAMTVYALSELINAIKALSIRRRLKLPEAAAEDGAREEAAG